MRDRAQPPSLWRLAVVAAAACAGSPRVPVSPPVELIESVPIETSLEHSDLRDAYRVWPEMIGRARRTLDVEQMYWASEPGGRLEPVLEAIEAAAARGVRVRLLSSAQFRDTYPEPLGTLGRRPGVAVRTIDFEALAGGIQHAKLFVVDGREAFFGSQNFDWRALEHIWELGLRIRAPRLVRAIADLFEADWRLAGGDRSRPRARSARFPERLADGTDATLVASPRGWLPDERLWELPRLVRLVDGARRTVSAEFLTYDASEGNALDRALRRAAARGVRVRVIVSDWAKRAGSVEGLQALVRDTRVQVRFLSVPPWSGGFVPYARVAHAKVIAVDGARAWVGTSNAGSDYFERSRNVGVVLEGGPLPARLERILGELWTGPYAQVVRPEDRYRAPRVE